ncbi:Uncharacterised protein [Vibrio paracholerae]|nr:Uncharacterised protein [Vibrio paracholerae]
MLADLFSQMKSRLYVRILQNDDELLTPHATTKMMVRDDALK